MMQLTSEENNPSYDQDQEQVVAKDDDAAQIEVREEEVDQADEED